MALLVLAVVGVLLGPPLSGGGSLAQAQPPPQPTSEEHADNILMLCDKFAQMGQLDMAVEGCKMAFEYYEANLGIEHDKTKTAAKMVVGILEQQGKSDEARAFVQKYFAPPSQPSQPSQPSGPSRNDQMLALVKAAEAAEQAGDFDVAVEKYVELLSMLESDGKDDTPVARKVRDELATAYGRLLLYGKAEPLLQKNLQQVKAGGNPRAIGAARQALAMHYSGSGQYDRAQPLLETNLREAELRDPEGMDVVLALVQLANLHDRIDQHAKARGYAERAYSLAQLSSEPALVVLTEVMLGQLYTTLGLYDQAEPLLRSALQAGQGDKTSYTMVTAALWSLGMLYRSKGDYAKAEKHWKWQLALEEETGGKKGMGLSGPLNFLAELYWAWGKHKDQIMPLAHRASEIEDRKYAALLSGGTEEMKVAFVQRYVRGTDRVVTYHLHFAKSDPEAARLALNTVLRRKGRVLDAVVDTMNALRERAGSADQDKLAEIREVRTKIATLTLGGKPKAMTEDAYRAKLEQLEGRDQQLQSELGSVGGEFRAEQAPIEYTAVQKEIPADAALVEIIGYSKFDIHYKRYADAFGPDRYGAYVLRRSGEIQAVDLGPASAIDGQISAFRKALADPGTTNVRELGRKLYDQVMKPVAGYVGDAEKVLLAPDGMLNLVPFSALVDGQGKYLVDRYEFTYLSSGRDLLSLGSRAEPKEAPLIVGNPDFDASGSGPSAGDDAHRGLRSVDFSKVRFPPLPGTAEEVEEIHDELDDSKLVTEGEATESVLKGVRGPVLLHVATHGFFLSDLARPKASSRGLELVTEGAPPSDAKQESPLVRSGLAFAGANKHDSSSGEDGVLTALEVTGLDLRGTQLVVLSACETGVGEVRNGDGVYGLRRALVIAGSESQVMSLWKVDDEATRDLMVEFYEALVDEEGRSAALRKVQREMASSDERSHPYYWAAFIASGRWDPMRFDFEQPEEEEDDDDWEPDWDFDWTWEARQLPGMRFDLLGNYIQPDACNLQTPTSCDGTFALSAQFEMVPIIGDPDDIIGFAFDTGVSLGFTTDAKLQMDAHMGLGPGLWLGPFSLAPYIGLGMNMIGTQPEEPEEQAEVDYFIMAPAFYWYAGGRARFAISSFGLEGYAVRTARGAIDGEIAEDVPNEIRVVTRAVINIEEEGEVAAGFHWTDYDADTVGGVGMGGLLSIGVMMDPDDW
jgi:CHAT domain-containing protein